MQFSLNNANEMEKTMSVMTDYNIIMLIGMRQYISIADSVIFGCHTRSNYREKIRILCSFVSSELQVRKRSVYVRVETDCR